MASRSLLLQAEHVSLDADDLAELNAFEAAVPAASFVLVPSAPAGTRHGHPAQPATSNSDAGLAVPIRGRGSDAQTAGPAPMLATVGDTVIPALASSSSSSLAAGGRLTPALVTSDGEVLPIPPTVDLDSPTAHRGILAMARQRWALLSEEDRQMVREEAAARKRMRSSSTGGGTRGSAGAGALAHRSADVVVHPIMPHGAHDHDGDDGDGDGGEHRGHELLQPTLASLLGEAEDNAPPPGFPDGALSAHASPRQAAPAAALPPSSSDSSAASAARLLPASRPSRNGIINSNKGTGTAIIAPLAHEPIPMYVEPLKSHGGQGGGGGGWTSGGHGAAAAAVGAGSGGGGNGTGGGGGTAASTARGGRHHNHGGSHSSVNYRYKECPLRDAAERYGASTGGHACIHCGRLFAALAAAAAVHRGAAGASSALGLRNAAEICKCPPKGNQQQQEGAGAGSRSGGSGGTDDGADGAGASSSASTAAAGTASNVAAPTMTASGPGSGLGLMDKVSRHRHQKRQHQQQASRGGRGDGGGHQQQQQHCNYADVQPDTPPGYWDVDDKEFDSLDRRFEEREAVRAAARARGTGTASGRQGGPGLE